jgi:Holliday junction resolvasome RuvABC endonuclease subunit
VKLILGLEEEPRTSHEADAYAVAICHALGSPLVGMAR